jgi:uncharacterized protein YciI
MTFGTTPITDDYMQEMLGKAKAYVAVFLEAGPNYDAPDARATIFEHARRNFALRAEGVLPIACPVTDDSVTKGLGIFDATVEDVTAIMDADPGVQAGIFTYEVHPVRSFPGDALPA